MHKELSPIRAGFEPLFHTNFYQTNWLLTELCNFNCSYCVNRQKRMAGLSLPRESMLRTLDLLRQTDKEAFFFGLAGGEVTLYKHLGEMLSYIGNNFSNKKYRVNLLSNGSASADKMQNLLDKCVDGTTMFIITLHLEEVNVEQVARKIASFGERANKYFLVKILMAPGKLQAGLNAVNCLRSVGFFNFRILHVLDLDMENGAFDPQYTQEEQKVIAALRGEYNKREYFVFFNEYVLSDGRTKIDTFTQTRGIKDGLFNYKGMFCAAGTCSARIYANGSLSKTGVCGERIFFLYDKNPFLDPDFTRPMRCPNPHCVCVAWAKLSKWRDVEDAPNWLRSNVSCL